MSTFERLRSGKISRRERKELAQQMAAADPELEIVHPDAAGIDIGNQSHFVAAPPGRDAEPVRDSDAGTRTYSE